MTERSSQNNTQSPTGIYIAPYVRTIIWPMDFFVTKASFTFTTRTSTLNRRIDDLFFRVSFPDYHFEMGFRNGELYIQRNDDRLSLKAEAEGEVMFFAIWSPTFITLTYRDDSFTRAIQAGANVEEEQEKRTRTIQTTATLPTNSVLQWHEKPTSFLRSCIHRLSIFSKLSFYLCNP